MGGTSGDKSGSGRCLGSRWHRHSDKRIGCGRPSANSIEPRPGRVYLRDILRRTAVVDPAGIARRAGSTGRLPGDPGGVMASRGSAGDREAPASRLALDETGGRNSTIRLRARVQRSSCGAHEAGKRPDSMNSEHRGLYSHKSFRRITQVTTSAESSFDHATSSPRRIYSLLFWMALSVCSETSCTCLVAIVRSTCPRSL
jgi:hypothetical protein